jgi:hypothetical protein
MFVKELIDALKDMPGEAEVLHIWDGEARTGIKYVWLSRNGKVITSDYGMVCYSTESRPFDAPTSEENKFWMMSDTQIKKSPGLSSTGEKAQNAPGEIQW